MRLLACSCLLAVPGAALAQSSEIVVEAGEPTRVPLELLAERLRAELPDARIAVAPAGPHGAASVVTVALTDEGELQVVYRDQDGRETTRIVADTHDPQAVAAAVAMIVANLHRTQLDSVLGEVAPAPAPAPPPAAVPAAPPPPSRASPSTRASRRQTRGARLGLRTIAEGAPPHSGFVAEMGALFAGVAASAGVGLAYDLPTRWRLGVISQAAWILETSESAWALALAVTRTDLGRLLGARLDLGLIGGFVTASGGSATGFMVGPTVTALWDLGSLGIGARLGAAIASMEGSTTVWPTASLVLELPL